MAMVIDNRYEIGDMVYLVTDPDQLLRIVTSLRVTKCDIIYTLSCGPSNCDAYDYEMSAEKSLINT